MLPLRQHCTVFREQFLKCFKFSIKYKCNIHHLEKQIKNMGIHWRLSHSLHYKLRVYLQYRPVHTNTSKGTRHYILFHIRVSLNAQDSHNINLSSSGGSILLIYWRTCASESWALGIMIYGATSHPCDCTQKKN